MDALIRLLPLFSLLLFSSCFSTETLRAAYTQTPVTIDGQLDELVWKKSPRYTLSNHSGQAQLAWDDQFLYVAAVLQDKDIVAKGAEDQLHHYQSGDVLEVFLKPENKKWYWEFYATPAGYKTSFYLPEPRKPEPVPTALKTAASIEGTLNQPDDQDKLWTVEMAIPVKDLGLMTDLKILIARYNHNESLNDPVLSTHPKLSKNDFHLLDEYGQLELEKQ